MAKNQNTFEKMRRDAEKKRRAEEKRARKQVGKKDDDTSLSEESTTATHRASIRRLSDAEILRMARNAK